MVLKGDKLHTSTSERSADKLDNLSCVRISEWEYTFQVIYVLGNVQRLSTQIGSVVNVIKQSLAQKDKCGSQY